MNFKIWSPILVFVVLAAACDRNGADPAPKTRPMPLVAVDKVEVKDVPVTVHAPVDLRPLLVAEIGSKTLGYLDAVLVERGDTVRRGQLLAVVRPSDLPDQLEAERAALAQFQANSVLAKSNFDRAKQLAPSGLVSEQELQQSTSMLAAAQAGETASKARIEAIAVRLGEMRIVSPLDGVVINRRLDPGVLVGPGTGGGIVTVARIDTLRVFVSVNEQEAPRVQVGQTTQLDLDAFPSRKFEGNVVRLSPAFDTATRTLDAEVHLPNPKGELRIGMYGRASIILEVHQNAVVVPASAVIINALGKYAFVLNQDRVQRREVETGVDGGDWLEIVRGIAVGDEVITAGAEALADGTSVRVSRAKAAAPSSPPTDKIHTPTRN
jgi:membrane fusion protein (multidrug efflux system)